MPVTFSIITPSFNQARFLKRALDSVASQSYPALEHLVYDPGSKDGSIEIAAQHPNTTLYAEPDDGQCDAINKGFAVARGDVLAWLNSDDYYQSNSVLETVARRFDHPDCPDIVYGRSRFVDEEETILRDAFINSDPTSLKKTLQHQVGIIQPSVFIKRSVYEQIGGLDVSYEYALDYEYWTRIVARGYKWAFVDEFLSCHRWWADMKTSSNRDRSLIEHCRVGLKYYGYVHWLWIHRLADCLIGDVDGIIGTSNAGVDPLDRARKICSLYIEYNLKNECARKQLFQRDSLDLPVKQTYFDMLNHSIAVRASESVETLTEALDDSLPYTWKNHEFKNDKNVDCIGYKFSEEQTFSINSTCYTHEIERTKTFLEKLKSTRQTDMCIIVGNGPSLKKTNWSGTDDLDLIMSNFSYYDQSMLLRAKFLTITNELVMRQAAYDLPRLQSLYKIFPIWLKHYTVVDDNTYYLNSHLKPEFSSDVLDWISWRSTVSFFNMQLAVSLGYKKIALVGFDHSYNQPQGVKEGDLIVQKGDDDNHFIKNYFKGKSWQAADVDNMEKVYQLAKEGSERMGIEIVNCTIGGNLDVFRRSTLQVELSTK